MKHKRFLKEPQYNKRVKYNKQQNKLLWQKKLPS